MDYKSTWTLLSDILRYPLHGIENPASHEGQHGRFPIALPSVTEPATVIAFGLQILILTRGREAAVFYLAISEPLPEKTTRAQSGLTIGF